MATISEPTMATTVKVAAVAGTVATSTLATALATALAITELELGQSYPSHCPSLLQFKRQVSVTVRDHFQSQASPEHCYFLAQYFTP